MPEVGELYLHVLLVDMLTEIGEFYLHVLLVDMMPEVGEFSEAVRTSGHLGAEAA